MTSSKSLFNLAAPLSRLIAFRGRIRFIRNRQFIILIRPRNDDLIPSRVTRVLAIRGGARRLTNMKVRIVCLGFLFSFVAACSGGGEVLSKASAVRCPETVSAQSSRFVDAVCFRLPSAVAHTAFPDQDLSFWTIRPAPPLWVCRFALATDEEEQSLDDNPDDVDAALPSEEACIHRRKMGKTPTRPSSVDSYDQGRIRPPP
jgi:hypothetical protein